MHNEFTAIVEHHGEWHVACCPEVPGANGQGRSRDEALDSLRDAIELIYEDSAEPLGRIALDTLNGGRGIMRVAELEAAVVRLSSAELTAFAQWFEEYVADAWDRQIEADIAAGQLDKAGRQADEAFEAGRCTPLQ